MPNDLQTQIVQLEERFRLAQMQSDVSVLDELVSPDLYFTTHWGQVITKADDLAFHRSGILRLTESTPSEQHIQFHDGVAIVSTLMHLVGTYQGAPIDQKIRYTRIWATSPNGTMQVIAGHASEIPPSP